MGKTDQGRLSNGFINSYAAINALNTMASTVPTLFLSMFMTDYLGISPVAVGTGLLIAKLIDTAISLIAGAAIEKSHTKKGKHVTWLRYLTGTLFFGNIMQLFDTTGFIGNPTARLFFTMLWYVMFHGSMNFNSAARAGIIPKLAGGNMEDRKRLTARQSQMVALWNIVSSAITLPIVEWVQKMTGSDTAGYFVAALLFSTCFVVANLSFCKKADAYDPPVTEEDNGPKKKEPTLKEIFLSVVNNKQMLILFLAVTFTQLGTQIYMGVLTYFFRATDSFSSYTVALTARAVFAFGASLVAPMIGKRFGKKSTIISGYALSAFAGILIWLFALRPDGTANLGVMILGMCLKQAADYFYKAYQANYWLDCGEYGYNQTGIDNRNMAVTVMSWPIKLSLLFGSSIAAYSLAFCGYQAPVDGGLPTFTHMGRFMAVIGLIPSIIMIIGVIIVAVFYKLNDKQAAEYARQNIEREKAAAGN